MNRVTRGFKLAGVSWRVIVAEPAILAVLAVGLVGTVLVSGTLFLLLFQGLPSSSDLEFPNYLVALPVLWLGTVVSTYCNVVVTVMADKRLRGDNPTVDDGMKVATARLNRIFSWTLISIAVGLLLQVIAERFRLAGYIASRILGVAWGLATTFVIPVVALEDDRSVTEAIKRSASIFKARWGESVVAQVSVSLAIFVCSIPAFVLVAMLMAASTPVGITAAVIVVVGVILISGALDAVVRVALYRYAMDGAVLGAFTAADLDGAYKPKGL